MLLNEPGRTDYDLNFNLFGFDVRTHPFFFVMPILLGRGLTMPNVNAGVGWLLLIVIFWVSILVHELGHALAFRYYGVHSRIVLYWMGGLAIPDGGNVWAPQKTRSLNPSQQIIVSLAGPIAGLLLAGVFALLVYSLQGRIEIWPGTIPIPMPVFEGTSIPQFGVVHTIFFSGIVLNVILNLFNLVPIYPLDGGQVARQLMLKMDPWNGLKHSLFLSLAACVLIILLSLKMGSNFMAFFFGFMAYGNYQALQGLGGRRW